MGGQNVFGPLHMGTLVTCAELSEHFAAAVHCAPSPDPQPLPKPLPNPFPTPSQPLPNPFR